MVKRAQPETKKVTVHKNTSNHAYSSFCFFVALMRVCVWCRDVFTESSYSPNGVWMVDQIDVVKMNILGQII